MTIQSASETLRDLLRTELAGTLSPDQVVLRSPAQQGGADVRLTVFLYAVLENAYLKSEDDRRDDAGGTRRRSPLTLDLYYLITAYPPQMETDPSAAAMTAQAVLSEAMRVLYENGILRGSRLRGTLVDRDDYALRVSLNPVTVEDMTRLWGVFPNEVYQASVSYLVTPVPIEPEREWIERRVVEHSARPHLLSPRGRP